ncbi:DUF423 domain-containing protein [Fulvivirga sp.]|uniref:DUF423 domain-containing protein n=1 Tax=Fulvivirga sp. TaxID=1931237 RepID=UPI0032F02FE4
MNRTIKSAALLGALAVTIGAFGAHALKPMLVENGRLATFETGVEYHFYHVLALLFIGLYQKHADEKKLRWAANAMIAGIIIFSGSLYVLCITNISFLGAITPIGGVCFIAGWILLFLAHKKSSTDIS